MLLAFSLFSDENAGTLKLNMENSITLGITNSILLHTLNSKKELFKMMITEKWRNYLPKIGVSYFGLKNLNLNQNDSSYNDIRLTIQQLVYDGGENLLEIESARLQEILNGEDFKIIKEKLILEIKKSYTKNLANRAKHYLIKKSFIRAFSEIRDVTSEKELGFATEAQKVTAETKFRDVELLQERSLGNIHLSEYEFKQLLNIDPGAKVIFEEDLFFDFFIHEPILDIEAIAENAKFRKIETSKSRIAIDRLKNSEKISENYWKPKLLIGGYVGQNINGPLPVKNDVYGINFSINMNLGSSSLNTSGNYGEQARGSGIQVIPGFGPQFVGRGENSFNSSNLQLFDNLSHSRKILEGQIQLEEAIQNHNQLERIIKSECYKSYDKLKESWNVLHYSNQKAIQYYEYWKTIARKFEQGFVKPSELLSVELETINSLQELTDAIAGYINSNYDFIYSSGMDENELKLVELKKNKGNSIFIKMFKEAYEFRNNSGNLKNKNSEKYKPLENKTEYEYFYE